MLLHVELLISIVTEKSFWTGHIQWYDYYGFLDHLVNTSLQEDIQKYLIFARMFKPKVSLYYSHTHSQPLPQISNDSAEYIVEQYKRLRQRDISGDVM